MKKLTYIIILLTLIALGWYFGFRSRPGTPVEPFPNSPVNENTATTTPIMVQYRIREMTSEGEFNDSLYFTKEEWAKLTQEELATMVKKRVDDWVNIVKNPPKSVGPTQEELQAQKEELQKQLDEINAQIKK